MIRPEDLTDADIGRKVIYEDVGRRLEGVLTSWNDRFVFVRFGGPTGEACSPEDIHFAFPRVGE